MTAVFISPHFTDVDPEVGKPDHPRTIHSSWSWASNSLCTISLRLSGISLHSVEAKISPWNSPKPTPSHTSYSFFFFFWPCSGVCADLSSQDLGSNSWSLAHSESVGPSHWTTKEVPPSVQTTISPAKFGWLFWSGEIRYQLSGSSGVFLALRKGRGFCFFDPPDEGSG